MGQSSQPNILQKHTQIGLFHCINVLEFLKIQQSIQINNIFF